MDPVTILVAAMAGAATVAAAGVTAGVTVAVATAPAAIRHIRARRTESLFRQIRQISEHPVKDNKENLRPLLDRVHAKERRGLSLNGRQLEVVAVAEKVLATL
ncbi:hypothetical protein DER44DRAFT_753564 [Fusarium oxysporum]|nr:hypothetical protein DER44DRAFT_753564 [Fusarium oxysporum]